tara:strand:+ start:81 stop:524 length:444 start_codon:yes stop_codon:yes gene_type:complete
MFSKLKNWLLPKKNPEEPKEIDPIVASLTLMLEVAWADHDVSNEEKRIIIAALQETFDKTTDEANDLFDNAVSLHKDSVGSYRYTKLINEQFSYEDKKEIIFVLWQIAYSDQHIDQWEEYTIRKLADLLHVDHSDFIDAKLRTKQKD